MLTCLYSPSESNLKGSVMQAYLQTDWKSDKSDIRFSQGKAAHSFHTVLSILKHILGIIRVVFLFKVLDLSFFCTHSCDLLLFVHYKMSHSIESAVLIIQNKITALYVPMAI